MESNIKMTIEVKTNSLIKHNIEAADNIELSLENTITHDMFCSSSNNTFIDNNQVSWLNKYKPTSFNNCYLKIEDKHKIDNWIQTLLDDSLDSLTNTNNTKSKSKETIQTTKNGKLKKKRSPKNDGYPTNCLFLYGPPGIGKTTIAQLILKKYKCDILEFNASDTRTSKIIQEKLNSVGGSHNVIDFMCKKKTKIAIILDEIDGLSLGDKGGLTEINNIIIDSRKNKTPFICISNNINKKMETLKRKSLFIKVLKPNDITITKIITNIVKHEKLNLDSSKIRKIVSKSQGDIRRVITLLEYLFRKNHNSYYSVDSFKPIKSCNDVNVTIDNDDNFYLKLDVSLDNYSRKTTDLAPYEMSDKLLNSYKSIDFFLENFNHDNSMTNWYLYENFIKYIDKNRIGSLKKKLHNINEIYTNFALGDIYENNISLYQHFELYEYLNLIKTHASSYWTNYNLNKASYNKMGMMNYSTLLNKTSLEYFNSKNHTKINKIFNSNGSTNITSSVCDIIYINFDKNNLYFLQNIIEEYKIDSDDFEKIIKISVLFNKDNLVDIKQKIKLLYIN